MHNLRLKFFLHQLEGGGARPPLATPMALTRSLNTDGRPIHVGLQLSNDVERNAYAITYIRCNDKMAAFSYTK